MSDKRTFERAQNHLRRVLTLIEALSPLRMPFTIQDAMHQLEDKTNNRIEVHRRTIERDIALLVSMNYITVYRKAERGIPGQYKMNLRITINIDILTAKAKP